VSGVPAVTSPLAPFDGLLDLERSRRFHAGGQPLGLDVVRAVLEALGPLPEPAVAFHVAGSEAKTSTTERIAAGLIATGRRTGTFTSPHLRDPRERLRVDLRLPGDGPLAAAVARVVQAMGRAGVEPSWFEALALTARVLFAADGAGAVVWETGLGGRLDATRVLPADVCVITSISLEHSAVLGDTLAAIAREKAGILRAGASVVVPADLPDEALEVVRARARELACPLRLVEPGAPDPATALAHAALAAGAEAGRLPEPDETVRAAVERHRVRGRHDLRDGVLFDGAHTVAAAERLAARLAGEAEPVAATVFAATTGRDALAMARALRAVSGALLLTTVPVRGVDPDELAAGLAREKGAPVHVERDPARALVRARAPGGRVLVTGSLYLVGLLLPEDATP